jgi:hypothetical protein
MSAIQKVSKGDDQVYEAVTANLAAGVLVIPSTSATVSGLQGIVVAADAAKNVLGVSAKSCVTEANRAAAEQGTLSDGYGFTDVSVPNATTTVFSHGVVPVTYTAVAVPYGAKLAAAAGGAVRAWIAADGPDAIVGHCRVVGGMSAAGGVGLAFINIS